MISCQLSEEFQRSKKKYIKQERLKAKVENNRKSLSKQSIAKEEDVCIICFETIEKEAEAQLDCCKHTYCKKCIMKWVTEVENRCPQCKK